MTKKQLKRQSEKERAVKELTLLLPAFSFMWESIKEGSDEADKGTRDYFLAKQICSVMSTRLMVYRMSQKDALDRWTELTKDAPELKLSVFLCGLALLSTHLELKNKAVNIGLNNEIVELQELCFEFFDTEQINKAFEWAEENAKKIGLGE